MENKAIFQLGVEVGAWQKLLDGVKCSFSKVGKTLTLF